MKIHELYKDDEKIDLYSYLNKFHIQDIKEFLKPTGKYLDNCFDYYNMDKACEMYIKHFTDDAYILCDSGDTDGITSAIILYEYMSIDKETTIAPDTSNRNISILIHQGKERGLQDEELFEHIKNNPRPFLIIPDSGTNDYEQVKILKEEYNIDVLVLDHHDIINPIEHGILVSNQSKKNKNISLYGSGCLVTHQFLRALDICLAQTVSFWSVDMVALSLISDSMNMSDLQNRTYYHYGIETLDCINNKFLKQLFIKFIGENVYYTQRDIAFKIVPKLNSICRSKNQDLKYLLITAFLEKNIDDALEMCGKAHQEQIALVDKIINDNIDKINKASNNKLVLFSCDDMPRSYSGLIAGKIMNLSGGKPTIVGKIINGELIGSLRSPIALRGDLDNNNLVEWAKGHEQSCGVLIKENNLQPLIDYYNSLNLSYEPCIEVLKSYKIKDIPDDLFSLFGDDINALWGYGIPKPIFEIHDIVFNSKDIQILGQNRRTLKITVDNINILFFNVSNQDKIDLGLGYINENKEFVYYDDNDNKFKLSIIGSPSINRYISPYGKVYINNQIIVDNYSISKYIPKTKENVFK